MDYIIVALMFYLFGELVGKYKGKKRKCNEEYNRGHKDGVDQIEDEILELSEESDKEIVNRIRKFIKSKKGD